MKARRFNQLIESESGIALPMAVAIIAIITLLGFTAVYLVDSQTAMSSKYRKQEMALHYAEAGINDYIWQMNQNPYFYIDTKDISKDYEKGHYVVKYAGTSEDPNQPGKKLITIRSTGWPGEDPGTRVTIEAQLKLRSFSEYMIFTNYEGTNTHTTTNYDLGNSINAQITRNNWILWKTGETASGPIHTNDTFHIMATQPGTGPTFNGKVTYSNQLKVYDKNKEVPPTLYCLTHNSYTCGHVKPTYNGGNPTWVPKMDLPSSNKSLKELAQKEGLYLRGRTCIYLNGSSITYTNHTDPTNKADRPRTLTPGDPLYPKNGVIFVDSMGGSSKWDLKRGNVFISGKFSGRLTVAAANDIYITGADPTNYGQNLNNGLKEGGIYYVDAGGQNTHDAGSRAMIGLVANENIYILHTGWPSAAGGQHDNLSGNDCWFVAPKNLHIDAVLFSVTGSFSLENYNLNEPPPKDPDNNEYKNTTLQEHLGKIYLYGALIQNTENYIGRYKKSALYDKNFNPDNKRWVYTTTYGWRLTPIQYKGGIYDPVKGYFPDPDQNPACNYLQTTGYTKNYQFDSRLLNVTPPHIMNPERGGWVIVNWKKVAPDYSVKP